MSDWKSSFQGTDSVRIGGIDTFADLDLVIGERTLTPPEPKTYMVDVPGGNGSIDLTDALFGDTAYSNRTHEFLFFTLYPENFEEVKTRVLNLFHGRRFEYSLSWDEGYVYEGRFFIDEHYQEGAAGHIRMRIDANPYKSKGMKTYRLNANGGRLYRFESGRRPVCPVVECTQPAKVVAGDGKTIQLGIGTWRLNDVVFTEGWNELYINTLELKTVTWNELKEGGAHGMTWDQAKSSRWYDLDLLNVSTDDVTARTWDDLQDARWEDLRETRWRDLKYQAASGADYTTYITYEWSDL